MPISNVLGGFYIGVLREYSLKNGLSNVGKKMRKINLILAFFTCAIVIWATAREDAREKEKEESIKEFQRSYDGM